MHRSNVSLWHRKSLPRLRDGSEDAKAFFRITDKKAHMKPRSTRRRAASRTLFINWLVLGVSAPFGLQAQLARAVEPSAPAALEEVVVQTGTKDKDSAVDVQSTPGSITSLSGAKLEEQGINNIRDLGTVVPGLSQPKTAVSYLNTSLYIRGIGEPDAQGEPSVAVYLDGLYQPKNLGLNQEFLDIERVEVFRGPQGQEFGHSALAGALRIMTTDPSEKKTLRALVAAGNYGDARLGFTASGPVADNVYASIAATGHRRDGFTNNVTLDRETNDVRYGAVRGKLRFKLSDDLDVVLGASGTRDTSTARGVQNLAFGDENAHNQIFPEQSFSNHAYTATVDYNIDGNLKLKSITGANGFRQTAFFDNTGDLYGRGSQLVLYKDKTYQEDLQLSGEYDRIQFVTGLFGYKENWFTNRRANTAANSVTDPAAIRYRPVYTVIEQDTTNLAWYGEGKYKLTQTLTGTLGLRFNHEEHSQDNQLYNLVATAPYQSTVANYQTVIRAEPQALVWSAQGEQSWSKWSPKASLDYKWTPELLQYLTYSEGTKSGGYDYRAQAPNASGQLQASTPYSPERAQNLETGLKAVWLGGALRTNVSFFYTQFKDIQITTTDPVLQITRRFNAGQGSTRGLEFETTVLPADGLQFDLSGGLLRAKLDTFSGAAPTITRVPPSAVNPNGLVLYSGPREGNDLPYAPHFQGRVAANWRWSVAGKGAVIFNASVDYQGASFTDTTNNPTTRLPAQTYLNGSISYLPVASHCSVTLSGQNLTNRRYALGEGFTPTQPLDGTAIYQTTNYNDPRTIFVALKYEL